VDSTEDIRTYWLDRVGQHITDTYAGVPISKFPEDLRVYEHLMWVSRANVVIEIGTQWGGGTLWFRDRLRTMEHYGRIAASHVFSIDHKIRGAVKAVAAADPSYSENITMMKGDVRDPSLPGKLDRLLPRDSRCFVVEDSAHTYDTTFAALNGFSHLVPLGGYFVVEDGCVDIEEMRASEGWPRGVLAALDRWLATPDGSKFAVRRDLECYGLTCHPHGFLKRTSK